jgi:uncharacterized protein YuzE
MRIEYDRQADAIYIRLRDAEIAGTRELDDHLIVDLGEACRTIGIELLFVSDYLRPEDVESLTVTTIPSS